MLVDKYVEFEILRVYKFKGNYIYKIKGVMNLRKINKIFFVI